MVARILRFAQGDEAFEIGAGSGPFYESENFVHFQIKDVAGCFKQVECMESFADLHKYPPDVAEHPGSFEAQILTVAYPGAGMAEYPAERNAANRPPRERRSHPLFRVPP